MPRVYYNEFDVSAAAWLRELIRDGLIPDGEVDERDIRDVQPGDLAGYDQCHFFAGICGWPFALQLAGWGDRPVWTGSCPCQPFSAAGKRKGAADERHLWPELRRLIAECRPPIIFGEQVASSEVVGSSTEAAFLNAVQASDYARANKLAKRLAQSRTFHYWARWVDGVQADLEKEDYAFRFKVLGAHSVGSPHIRQRLFWVADSELQRTWTGNGQESSGEQRRDRPTEHGATVRLADRDGQRLEGRQGERGDDGQKRQAIKRAGGPWSQCDLILCRDGKTRRIPAGSESVFLGLADGLPGGVDDSRRAGFPLCEAFTGRNKLLKGYGNAINPVLAAMFVEDTCPASSRSIMPSS